MSWDDLTAMLRRKVDEAPAKPREPVAPRPLEHVGCDRCDHLGYRTEMQEGRAFAVAVRCDCAPECHQCRGSGFVHVRTEGSRRGAMVDCQCRAATTAARLYTAARIPARYAGARLEGDRADRVRAMLDAGRSLTVTGSLGRGKTHSLCAIAHEVTLRRGWSCRYVDVAQLAQDRREAMRPGAEPEEPVKALCAARVLLVDELGRGRGTDFEFAIVEELIGRRYEMRAPIYAATNVAREQLREVIGDRSFSRLVEMGSIVPMGGEDQRAARAGEG
jgi:DNA replication protein DnaC